MTTDWHEIMAVEDWRRRNRLVEEALRRFLATLPEDGPSMSTGSMLDKLLPLEEIDATTREQAIKQVMKIASNAAGLRDTVREISTKGWNAGREVNRYRWSYRSYKPVPGTPERPRTAHAPQAAPPASIEPAGSQALGAANSGARWRISTITSSTLTELRLDLELVTRRVEKLEAAMKQPPLMEG